MAYIQVFLPNLSVAAIRGWCLKYVDDAGDAPSRKATAKIAYQTEKKAKRIKTSTPPKGIWVVGFLEFTQGYAKDLGHVFFIKYLGNGKYDIRDSEVAAGARKPYGNINELLAWFGAYNPKYLGWSAYCDGRQYAKVKEKEMLTEYIGEIIVRFYRGSSLTKAHKQKYVGKVTAEKFAQLVATNKDQRNAHIKLAKAGKLDTVNHLPSHLRAIMKGGKP